MQHNPTIEVCAVGKLFNQKNTIYEIPIYQREYAWENTEILQLLQDIADYAHEHPKQDYYLGTLVVYPRERDGQMVHETIDGQQRLTTLFILLNVLRVEIPSLNFAGQPLPLTFESRPKAIKALRALADDKIVKDDTIALEIVNAYEIMMRQFLGSQNSYGVSTSVFAKYLLEKVKIAIVPLPEDTDLNHYFETMNNRGEQLEKHEILKAQMLEKLSENERTHFHDIWEACSNMHDYVQSSFKPDQRTALFGEFWNTFQENNFANFWKNNDVNIQTTDTKNEENDSTNDILHIIEKPIAEDKSTQSDKTSERFTPVINFPNFLLHVLRIQTGKDIPLDDKQLLKVFDEYLKADTASGFVRTFAYNLLRCRFLLDAYVLKRETTSEKDGWSLLSMKRYDSMGYVNTFSDTEEQNAILMLLSMFHVSAPTMVYKHWLNGVLHHLYHQTNIDAQTYKTYLEGLAKAFVFDRYLATNPKNYYEIIYTNQCKVQNNKNSLNLEKLSYGNIENILIFNYLDYLLWQKYKGTDTKITGFKFTFRSSVEHHYPQNPDDGEKLEDIKILHSFGNLCLISHSKNSKLSNQSPIAKKGHYKKTDWDSIKQGIMMQEDWGDNLETVAQTINKHYKEMINILLQ